MAIEHITKLRKEFPNHFDNKEPKIGADDYLRIPTQDPDPSRRRNQFDDNSILEIDEADFYEDSAECVEEALADMPVDDFLEPLPEDMTDTFGGHPGGLKNDPNPVNGVTVIERLAFYLPFHIYPNWWGIYLFPEGIQKVRQDLRGFFKTHSISARDQVKIAKRLLYHHEFYHHSSESFATRLEAVFNYPCYLSSFQTLYNTTFGTKDCLEETCANSYAREKTVSLGITGVNRIVFRNAIDDWFRGTPPGYKEAAGSGLNWDKCLRPKFYESCLNACATSLGAPHRGLSKNARTSVWSVAGYFDRGIGNVRSRISYIVRKGSPLYNRLPLDAKTCLKSRSFKQKLVSLGIGRFLRQGGAHELWQPSEGGRPVPIPRHDGFDIPKGTMRSILRQLGSSMSIEEFLAAS